MQESPVPQLHLQTKHQIYAIKSKEQQKIGLIYRTLPRENCWQGCTAMICNEKVSLIGPSCQIWRSNQNKCTREAQIWRVSGIWQIDTSRWISEIFSPNIRNPKISAEDWRREKFKMSAEEDTELRDMVAQTLESKGVLGKIRVRKCVVLVKEEVEVKS